MPIARFQMPDGRIGRFEVPDGTTPEQAQSLISESMKAQPAATPPETGYLANVGADLTNRVAETKQNLSDFAAGGDRVRSGYRAIANGPLGLMSDIVSQTAKSGLETVSAAADAYNPNIKKKIGEIGQYLSTTAPAIAGKEAITQMGEAAAPYVAEYKDLASYNQNLGKDVEALGNVAAALPAAQGIKQGAKAAIAGTNIAGDLLYDAGQAVENIGQKQESNRTKKFLTKTFVEDDASNSRERGFGPLKRSVVEPDSEQAAMLSTLQGVGVDHRNSLRKNANVIDDGIENEAEFLQKHLQENDIQYTPDQVNDAVYYPVMKNLKENIFLNGDTDLMAKKAVKKLSELMDTNPLSASGLLQVRKDFDKWVRKQKGDKAFDLSTATPVKTVVDEFRSAINGFLSDTVPTTNVRDSLRKQALLYKAGDILYPKAAKTAPSAMGRAGNRLKGAIPQRASTAIMATALGGAGYMAPGAAILGGKIAGAGLAGYGAYRAANSPILKKAAGKTIKAAGSVMKASKKPQKPSPAASKNIGQALITNPSKSVRKRP